MGLGLKLSYFLVPLDENGDPYYLALFEYEYPFEKIEMLEKIGSGHFGIVQKAIADNIAGPTGRTHVAVKMLKGIYHFLSA